MTHRRLNQTNPISDALGMGSRAAGAATHGGADSAEDARRATITAQQVTTIRDYDRGGDRFARQDEHNKLILKGAA